jgi:hypothetical protein
MKLLHQAYVKNGEGEVKLVPEEGETYFSGWAMVQQRLHVAASV